jgi:hypothetical protein
MMVITPMQPRTTCCITKATTPTQPRKHVGGIILHLRQKAIDQACRKTLHALTSPCADSTQPNDFYDEKYLAHRLLTGLCG